MSDKPVWRFSAPAITASISTASTFEQDNKMRFSGLAGCVFGLIALAATMAPQARAADFKPAIVFDEGGRDDHAFNQAAEEGAERFKAETGIGYLSADVSKTVDHEAALRQVAQQGATIIVAVGYAYSAPVETVAKDFPNTEFTVIDGDAMGPNIQTVTMREQEGSYLVGMVAAMASKTGKIGFIGGIDMPLIRKFAAGYKLGALRVNPHIEVVEDHVGVDAQAWDDPTKAEALARHEIHDGADVIYAAAGASGVGVYKAAKEAGTLAIGVDTNQNGLFPGTMLTSMVKRVDVVVEKAFLSAKDGTWTAGPINLGLANGAVGWALDDNNRALISPAMEKRVNAVAQDIIAGRIRVSDYIER
jgi:basic membrane protein A